MNDLPRQNRAARLCRLTVRSGLRGGTSEYSFDSGVLVVGRAEDCDIRLDSERASRKHAAFRFVGRSLVIEDLGSANGTYVNDVRIGSQGDAPDGRPTTLSDDDVIRIAEFTIRISGSVPKPDGVFLRLKGLSEGFAGLTVEFSRTPSLVGRADDVDVPLIHPSISRQHARVVCRMDGTVFMSDLDSANGLAVNGIPLHMSEICQGDRVRIGMAEFIAELPREPTLTGAPGVPTVGTWLRISPAWKRRAAIAAAVLAAGSLAAVAGWIAAGRVRNVESTAGVAGMTGDCGQSCDYHSDARVSDASAEWSAGEKVNDPDVPTGD